MAIVSFDFFSTSILRTFHTKVILPCGEMAANEKPPYKTLYFLPGFSNVAEDILTLSDIRNQATQHGIAVVLVNGDNSFYIDRGPMLEYSKMIEELVTVTRAAFNLSDKREDTFIGGMSMGGYGSFYNGLKYSDTFGKIALTAPAFDFYDLKVAGTDICPFPESFLNRFFESRDAYYAGEYNYRNAFESFKNSGKQFPEIFYSMGDADLVVGDVNKPFKAFLDEKAIPHTYCPVTGGHDFIFLQNMLPHLFDFLAGKADTAE